jgi:hypothetical protein
LQEERANNQNSQNNEQAEEPVDNNADDNGLFELKEYLSHGNGMVFVEWVE